MPRLTGVALALTVGTAACGGGGSTDSFLGTYQVTEFREALSIGADPVNCANPPVVAGGPMQVRIAVDDVTGSIRLATCETADASSCTDVLGSFSTGSPGLVHESYNTQTAGGVVPCQLYHTKQTIARDDNGAIHIELYRRYEGNELPEEDCTLELAEQLGQSPDCEEVVVIDATKL